MLKQNDLIVKADLIWYNKSIKYRKGIFMYDKLKIVEQRYNELTEEIKKQEEFLNALKAFRKNL